MAGGLSVSRRQALRYLGVGGLAIARTTTLPTDEQTQETWQDSFEQADGSKPDGWTTDPTRPPPEVFRVECSQSTAGDCSMYVAGKGGGADSAVGNVKSLPNAQYATARFDIRPVGDPKDGTQIRLINGDRVNADGGFAKYGIENKKLSGSYIPQPVSIEHDTWHTFRFDFNWQEAAVGWTLTVDDQTVATCKPSANPGIETLSGIIFRQASFRRGKHYVDNVLFNTGSGTPTTGDQRDFYTIRVLDIYDNPVADAGVRLINLPAATKLSRIDPDAVDLLAAGQTNQDGRAEFGGKKNTSTAGRQTKGRPLPKDDLPQLAADRTGDVFTYAVLPSQSSSTHRRWFASIATPVSNWAKNREVDINLNRELLFQSKIVQDTNGGSVAVWREVNGTDPSIQRLQIGISRRGILFDGNTAFDSNYPVHQSTLTHVIPENISVNYPLSGLEMFRMGISGNGTERLLSLGATRKVPAKIPFQAVTAEQGFTGYTRPSESERELAEAARDALGYVPVVGTIVGFSSTMADIFNLGKGYERKIGSSIDFDPNTHDYLTEVQKEGAWAITSGARLNFPDKKNRKFGAKASYVVRESEYEFDFYSDIHAETKFTLSSNPPRLS